MTELLEAHPYVNPWEPPVLEGNPWILPPLPEGYDPPPWRPSVPKLPGVKVNLSLRQVNALLNLALACCVVFLTLVFPVLLYRSLTGSDAVLGWRFVVVTGDSMEPAIRAGALLLARETPFSRLEEGDVIVFESGGKLNTHRIVALEYGAAITKGDAALLPDSVPVTPEMYRCRVRKVFNGFARVTRALTE
ncbi:MAG: signal peptidase I [Oscillospiraceae bacterium]|jgi:signal peptidase I|nr:signal peptidase I [Oscillospiraceae bacterium]